MSASTSITSRPAWQQERALVLHQAFEDAHARIEGEGERVMAALDRLKVDLAGMIVAGRPLKARKGMLRDNYYKWRNGGRQPAALLQDYSSGRRKIPDELVLEWQRMLTLPLGGRDKHQAGVVAPTYAEMVRLWRKGDHIKGLGTWRDYWRSDPETAGLPMPGSAPEFPWPERTMRRYGPSKAVGLAGRIGHAAAKKHLAYVSMDYSKVRRCELITFDDCRIDIPALDEATGDVCSHMIYAAMEVASRSIIAFVIRPRVGIKAEDVDELVIRTLQAPGYGIGDGYTTHLLFERGTIACSPATQAKLEGLSDGGIKVHRTGMLGTIRWTGSAADRASGNWAGKAMIESFWRILHGLLLHVPGQRGNTMENQPMNLGAELPKARNRLRDQKDDGRQRTLVEETERLQAVRMAALRAGSDAKLELDLLTSSQLWARTREAMELYNSQAGRAFQGHGTKREAQIAPGVWVSVAD